LSLLVSQKGSDRVDRYFSYEDCVVKIDYQKQKIFIEENPKSTTTEKDIDEAMEYVAREDLKGASSFPVEMLDPEMD
jgi:hypothetical protein